MPIHYITHSDPPRADGKRTSQHLRPTKLQSVDLMALVDEMHTEEPIFTRGTSTGVLYALARTLPKLLAQGAAVYIEGLGTFTPQLEGDISGDDAREVRVSGVDFRADDECLKLINSRAAFVHVLEKRSSQPTNAEVDAFLDEHFARHSTLQRHELQEHFNLSKRNALRLMELLVATKRLMPKGEEHVRRYVRGEALRVES
jgi:hypothetical protein